MIEYENILNLFDDDLNENNESKKSQAIEYLNKNQLETTSQDFFESLNKSKHSNMLTHYTIPELSEMKLFKIPGLNIGYALKKFNNGDDYSEIVAVHNNEPDIKGIGNEVIQSAIRNGGKYLDHFDGFLSQFYQNNGFIEYKRDKYNPEYDPNGTFRKKYGEQDVIYRQYQKKP